jgi:hypothetical protein
MRIRLTLVAAAVVAACVGGVALAAVSLSRFTARPGEETGFTPQGTPHVYRTARSWLAGGGETGRRLTTDAARLSGEGFVAALVQHMTYVAAPSTGGGISLVLELGSPNSADAELPVQLRQDIAGQGLGATIRRFKVRGVPGARGFTVVISGMPGSAANALFTESRCLC